MLNFTPARVLRSGLFCALSLLAVMPATAASRFVAAGGDLQGALSQAGGGDTITIAANAQFTGHFRLPVNNSGQWITIQSSAMSNLPSTENRVSPSQAQYMPKLVTPDASPVLVIASGANNYRIQGLEFTVASGVYVQDLIQFGTGGETSTSQLPLNLTIDRCLIHGDSRAGGKRGVALNSGLALISNSYFWDFFSTSQDTQAILGWNGSGPFTISNNHLEAGTEIVAFGGAPTAIPGVIPSDITIQNNEFYKPTRYYAGSSDYAGIQVWAKNMIEFKNGQRATIKNNTFTNNFQQADQLGFSILLNVRDENGAVPWATVNNITVDSNVFQHTGAGALLMGHDADGGGNAHDLTFRNNLWMDMGVYGGSGRMYEIIGPVDRVTIDHETAFPTSFLLDFVNAPSTAVHVTNSIFATGGGVVGPGTAGGESTMATYANDGSFQNNVIIGGNANQYSGSHFANNWFPGSVSQVGFADPNNGNYALASTSPYHGLAIDGKDVGDTALSNSASAPTSPALPTGWVNLISKNSGMCLDVAGQSVSVGAGIQQWACSGGDNQKFQLTPVNGGYKITAKNSGLQLNIWGGEGATYNGAWLKQASFWGGSNEIFQLTPVDGSYYKITALNSGKALDVWGVSKSNGAPIQQWDYLGGDNQKWQIVPVQ